MKVFHISWNDPETVFNEILWKKNFTVYPSLYKPYTKGENKGNCPLNIKHLSNCSFELFTLTEASAGGTFLYIANHLWYKRRNDLNIYKKNELESTFIELVNPRRSNIVVGVNYWHRPMDLIPLTAITWTISLRTSLKNKNLFMYLETLMLTSWIRINIIRPMSL